MVQDTKILEPILGDPRMPILLSELQSVWKKEQRLREEYYEKIQPGNKWEFINGKIIMHSPAKDKHTNARENLGGLLRFFVDFHEMGRIYSETALVSLIRNDYLPDIAFFSNEKAAKFRPNTWKYPAPDFVVEVLSDSTAKNDRGIKKDDYAANGIQEYWIIDPDNQSVEQYILDKGKKEFKLFSKKSIHDSIESKVIAGLSFPIAAIFDVKKKMEIVKEMLLK